MFDFSDLSDAEVTGNRTSDFLLKEGRCDYKVLEAVPHVSKAGNNSIRLNILAKDHTGKRAKIYNYLNPKFLIMFMDCHDMHKEISEKKVDPIKLVGLTGTFENKHEEWNGENKNAVAYFAKSKSISASLADSQAKEAPAPTAAFDDEDIPF